MDRIIRIGCLLFILNQFLPAQDLVIPLWSEGAPDALQDSTYLETLDTDQPYRIRNVYQPTISIYFPADENPDRTAIIICPGGGYRRLAFDHEGVLVAEWFKSMGIVGIVLKYRLPDDRIMKNKTIGPLQDVQKAIRLVRRNGAEWKIDPYKIGVMGFSAGGHLAASASTLYDDSTYCSMDTLSARPDFSILIYPVISFREGIMHQGSRSQLLGEKPSEALIRHFSLDEQVNDRTPSTFIVHSIDDKSVPIENSLNYFQALRNHHVCCEIHLYETGGHGFGINRGKGTEKNWPDALQEWLKMHGY